MKTKQEQTSLRLTSEAKRLLTALALKLGLSQAGVIELAIRRLAELEKVDGALGNGIPLPSNRG